MSTKTNNSRNRTEVFGINAAKPDQLFVGLKFSKPIAPQTDSSHPKSSSQTTHQDAAIEEKNKSIVVHLPQITDDDTASISNDNNSEHEKTEPILHPTPLPAPITFTKPKTKSVTLITKPVSMCEVVQITPNEINTLKHDENVVYKIHHERSDTRRSPRDSNRMPRNPIRKIDLDMSSTPKRLDRLPTLLKGVLDEQDKNKIVYIPLSEKSPSKRRSKHISNRASNLINLSSIKHFQNLQYREYRANIGSLTIRELSEKPKLQTISPTLQRHEFNRSQLEELPTGGGSRSSSTTDGQSDYLDEEFEGIRELETRKQISQENGIFKLPAILRADAAKHKIGKDKILQDKFNETIKIYQRTKERIMALETKAQLEAMRQTLYLLPRRKALNSITTPRRSKSARLKVKKPVSHSLDTILSSVPITSQPDAIVTKSHAEPLDPTRSEHEQSSKMNRTEHEQSSKTNRTKHETTEKVIQSENENLVRNEPAEKIAPTKLDKSAERKGQITPRKDSQSKLGVQKNDRKCIVKTTPPSRNPPPCETMNTKQMFSSSDYDIYSHTKHRKSKIRTPRNNQSFSNGYTPRDPDPKEFMKVKIGQEPRTLDLLSESPQTLIKLNDTNRMITDPDQAIADDVTSDHVTRSTDEATDHTDHVRIDTQTHYTDLDSGFRLPRLVKL